MRCHGLVSVGSCCTRLHHCRRVRSSTERQDSTLSCTANGHVRKSEGTCGYRIIEPNLPYSGASLQHWLPYAQRPEVEAEARARTPKKIGGFLSSRGFCSFSPSSSSTPSEQRKTLAPSSDIIIRGRRVGTVLTSHAHGVDADDDLAEDFLDDAGEIVDQTVLMRSRNPRNYIRHNPWNPTTHPHPKP